MSHANAKLTPQGRLTLVQRIESGRPVAHVAEEMGVSSTTAWRWWRRYQGEGEAGLFDRSSVAHSHPARISPCLETLIRIVRSVRRRGALFISQLLEVPASTVGRVLSRYRVPRLSDCDPVSGQVIRASRRSANSYEHEQPGSLIHIDVKKLGRIPEGGGWRVHGRSQEVRGHGLGYDYVHTAIDDHSRLAYAEVHADERGGTAAGFLRRAASFYASLGVTVQRVLSDNAMAYRNSRDFRAVVHELSIKHRFIRPHCPWTNGKVERLNRTLAREWAYSRAYTSNLQRTAALRSWLDYYNLDRPHLGIAGLAPIDRVNNGRGQYT